MISLKSLYKCIEYTNIFCKTNWARINIIPRDNHLWEQLDNPHTNLSMIHCHYVKRYLFSFILNPKYENPTSIEEEETPKMSAISQIWYSLDEAYISMEFVLFMYNLEASSKVKIMCWRSNHWFTETYPKSRTLSTNIRCVIDTCLLSCSPINST